LTLLSAILKLDAAAISASISQLYCLEPHSGKRQSRLNHFMHFDRLKKIYKFQCTTLTRLFCFLSLK
jgi:hypothetical protein